MSVKYIPEGYSSVTPYLIVKGAAAAIDFYKKVFGAVELFRIPPDEKGRIGHAEIRIGNSPVMLADEFPERDILSPQSIGKSPVSMYLYVEDVDATAARAIASGAKVLKPVADQFYGDRSGFFADPFGHQWTIATHKEDVSLEEMEERMAALPKHK